MVMFVFGNFHNANNWHISHSKSRQQVCYDNSNTITIVVYMCVCVCVCVLTQVQTLTGETFARNTEALFMETSAKDGRNVQELFRTIGK